MIFDFSSTMKIIKTILATIITVGIAGCAPSKEQQAADLIDKSIDALGSTDTIGALALLDSVHTHFPTCIDARRNADTIYWHIQLVRLYSQLPSISQTIATADSIIVAKTKDFKFVKDDRYQDIGSFEHRFLRTENNTSRCNFKPTVDEHGTPAISIHYTGDNAHHDKIKIRIDTITIYSASIADADITRFDSDGQYHEMIQIPANDVTDIFQQIATSSSSKVRVSLLGKPDFTFHLTSYQLNAIAETYTLQQALHTLYRYNDAELRTQQKIESLRRRLNIE